MQALRFDIRDYPEEYIGLTNKIIYLVCEIPGELIETHRLKLLKSNNPIFKTPDKFRHEKLKDRMAEQLFHSTNSFHTLKIKTHECLKFAIRRRFKCFVTCFMRLWIAHFRC